MILPMGAVPKAPPPSVLWLARAQRAPPLCVVRMLALFCVCFPSSVSARLCGARVLDDVRRGPGSAPAKPAAKSCLAGPKSALGSLILGAKKSVLTKKSYLATVMFRPRGPSKKFRQVVRTRLVQFSASELQ